MRLMVLLPLLLLAGPLLACDTGTSPESGPSTVSVDFSRPAAAAPSMTGFLHGFDADSPADSLVEPLRPALWRAGALAVAPGGRGRAERLGMRPVLLLSDLWGYHFGTHPEPHTDWAAWEAFVRQVARNTRGQGYIYDVWNEPDIPIFWAGTEAQFFETFRRAERVLRQELGSEAVLAGPSYANWDPARFTAFMDRARASGTRIEVLTWHEFHLDPTLPLIEEHLQWVRDRFMGGRYAAVGVRELQIQEVGTQRAQFLPGTALAALYYIEAGAADGAARACWAEPDGVENCWNSSLNGLLTANDEPRAVWWAYRAYASTLAARIPSSSNAGELVSFATRGGEGTPARVVVAHYGRHREQGAIDAFVELENVRAVAPGDGARVRITVRRIPDTGRDPLLEMPVVQQFEAEVGRGDISVSLPGFAVYEVMVIDIEPLPAAR